MSKGKAPKPKTVTIRPNHYYDVRKATHILYRCFNRKKVLLYVGITNHPEERFKHHLQNKVWWKYVDLITLQSFSSRRMLVEAEAGAIQAEKPMFNIQIPNGAVPVHPRTRGMARNLYPHASKFATILPDHNFYLDQSIEQQLYPCVECKARAIYCDGDTVACRLCSAEWSFDKWYAMTFEVGHDTPVGDQIPLL